MLSHPYLPFAARHVLFDLEVEEMIEFADQLLDQSVYTYSVGELITWEKHQRSLMPIRGCFESALEELGCPIPDEKEALVVCLKHYVGVLAEQPENLHTIFRHLLDYSDGLIRSTAANPLPSVVLDSYNLDFWNKFYLRACNPPFDYSGEALIRYEQEFAARLQHSTWIWLRRHCFPDVAQVLSHENYPRVAELAKALGQEKSFSDLPVLADALEEVGCTSSDVLDHCRGLNQHQERCWVLDLLEDPRSATKLP